MTRSLDVATLVLRYEGGESVASLARTFGVDASTVSGRLRKAGVTLRGPREATRANLARDPSVRERMGRPRTLSVNEAFFDEWTPESLYIAGFIHADGYVNGGSRLVIGLQTRDEPHLRNMVEVMGSTHPVFRVIKEWGEGCRVEISSVRLCRRLEEVGVKTNGLLRDPAVVASRDYWRGLVDGDGSPCVGANGRKHLSVVGDEETCAAWLAFSRAHGAALRINVRPHKSIFCVHMTGKDAVRMAEVLYSGAGLALPRKRAIAEAWAGEVAA